MLASIIFLPIAVAFLVRAANPRSRGKWGWGRSEFIPITRIGSLGIAMTFFLIGITPLLLGMKLLPEEFAFLLPLIGFLVFLAAGFHDNFKARRGNDAS